MKDIVRDIPCPKCGLKYDPEYPVLIHVVLYYPELDCLIVGCPKCGWVWREEALDKASKTKVIGPKRGTH